MSEREGTISLDRESLKVLASDTRIDILKLLDQRKFTVTELARELDLNKATCFEHLEKLAQVELVQKLEDDRKWVYYQLTWKGRRILHPEKMAIALMLSSALGASLAAIAAFWFWFTGSLREITILPPGEDANVPEEDSSGASIMQSPAEDARSAPAEPPPAPPESMPEPTTGTEIFQDPVHLWIAIGATVIVLALCVAAFVVWRRAKSKRSAPLSAA